MTVIELPDDQAAALKAKAAAEGLSLADWLSKLALWSQVGRVPCKPRRISFLAVCAMFPLRSWRRCPEMEQASTIITSMVGRSGSHDAALRGYVLLDCSCGLQR